MPLTLKQLRIGKVDGKHEYLTPVSEREQDVFDAFLIPESVEPERIHNGDVFFVEGFRGTGKTSLLRWHAEQQRRGETGLTDFVLFKSDLTESDRMHLSKEVGISWTDVDAKSMEIAQDFKAAWTWFILHKIGENLKANPDLIANPSNESTPRIIRMLGLDDESIFKKALGFMPRLEGGHIKIRADLKFFEAELGGDFKSEGTLGATTLDALNKRLLTLISKLKLVKNFYLYFDELEAFYHNPEQHKRDQRMVRDLLFSVALVNGTFRKNGVSLHVVAAVRSEVVDSMGSLGQEVDRLVHDRGFLITWNLSKKSLHHPLIQMIRRKIEASEKASGCPLSPDPIASYFPAIVNGKSVDTFILDRSFYKPRDIVWRLSLAQKLFPNENQFTAEVLNETETEYSAKLWDEVRYELSATYSDEEVDSIEGVLSGGSSAFELPQIEFQFDRSASHSPTLVNLLHRRSVREILSDLYRLGAIGNAFRTGSTGTDIRNRWSFRGDPTLLVERRMEIHPALLKRLSAVATRKRGSRPSR